MRMIASLIVVLLLRATASAQTFPLTVKAYWNPNPLADNVTGYTIALDGGTSIAVGPGTTNDANCPAAQYPSGCVLQTLTIPASGQHTFVVVAINQWGSSPPLTVTMNINGPGQIVWVKLTK